MAPEYENIAKALREQLERHGDSFSLHSLADDRAEPELERELERARAGLENDVEPLRALANEYEIRLARMQSDATRLSRALRKQTNRAEQLQKSSDILSNELRERDSTIRSLERRLQKRDNMIDELSNKLEMHQGAAQEWWAQMYKDDEAKRRQELEQCQTTLRSCEDQLHRQEIAFGEAQRLQNELSVYLKSLRQGVETVVSPIFPDLERTGTLNSYPTLRAWEHAPLIHLSESALVRTREQSRSVQKRHVADLEYGQSKVPVARELVSKQIKSDEQKRLDLVQDYAEWLQNERERYETDLRLKQVELEDARKAVEAGNPAAADEHAARVEQLEAQVLELVTQKSDLKEAFDDMERQRKAWRHHAMRQHRKCNTLNEVMQDHLDRFSCQLRDSGNC